MISLKRIEVFMNLRIYVLFDDSEIKLNDGTHKIFLNTKGNRDGISEELQMLLEIILMAEKPESQLRKEEEKNARG